MRMVVVSILLDVCLQLVSQSPVSPKPSPAFCQEPAVTLQAREPNAQRREWGAAHAGYSQPILGPGHHCSSLPEVLISWGV